MSLYVVTATLNGLDHTQFLYEAVKQVDPSVPIARFVVVDNGSTDGTLEYFAQHIKNGVQLIANDRNLGAATAWNQGILFALKNGASAILVAGNDTCPWAGTIERLYGLLRDGCLFVTGTAVPYDKTGAVQACPPDAKLLAAPDFSFMMMTPMAIERVAQWDHEHDVTRRFWSRDNNQPLPTFMSPHQFGLADERYYPAYFEDGDWHLRAKKAGVPMLRDPGAFFRHDTSFTIRHNDDVGRMNREQSFARNAELFKSKWGGLPHEVDAVTAKPLNVSDQQWAQMSGGRPVAEIDKAEAVAQAKRVYQQYGIQA